MTAPCVVCGGTDFSTPRGFYRQPGASYEGGTVDQPQTGPYHFDCADLWASQRKPVNRRQTAAGREKITTSKPHKRNVKR